MEILSQYLKIAAGRSHAQVKTLTLRSQETKSLVTPDQPAQDDLPSSATSADRNLNHKMSKEYHGQIVEGMRSAGAICHHQGSKGEFPVTSDH